MPQLKLKYGAKDLYQFWIRTMSKVGGDCILSKANAAEK